MSRVLAESDDPPFPDNEDETQLAFDILVARSGSGRHANDYAHRVEEAARDAHAYVQNRVPPEWAIGQEA
ncbi:hypothetical protein [Kitasatospora sp. NPDC001175]|uniref:hypothetical protein n=1 Tax=Kitasatospora sp. NPDC001175 TaxID=3157103 RepID=UPI003D06B573